MGAVKSKKFLHFADLRTLIPLRRIARSFQKKFEMKVTTNFAILFSEPLSLRMKKRKWRRK